MVYYTIYIYIYVMYIYVMYIHCWANTQFSNFLDPIGEIRQAPLALLSPWSGLVGTPSADGDALPLFKQPRNHGFLLGISTLGQ